MQFIAIPVIVAIITYGIYKLFELFVCRRERLNIIEKLNENQLMSATDRFMLPGYSQPRISYGSLKGGCLLLGIGLGLLLGFIISASCIPDYYGGHWKTMETAAIIYGACVLIFGGIGLLTAFIIELKLEKKKS